MAIVLLTLSAYSMKMVSHTKTHPLNSHPWYFHSKNKFLMILKLRHAAAECKQKVPETTQNVIFGKQSLPGKNLQVFSEKLTMTLIHMFCSDFRPVGNLAEALCPSQKDLSKTLSLYLFVHIRLIALKPPEPQLSVQNVVLDLFWTNLFLDDNNISRSLCLRLLRTKKAREYYQ